MIIDLILDRKDGVRYCARDFYNNVSEYGSTWPELARPICRAMDGGDEEEVRRELCRYITEQGYPEELNDWINSVDWLNDD